MFAQPRMKRPQMNWKLMRDEVCLGVYEAVFHGAPIQKNPRNDGFIANIEYSIEF